MLFSRHALQMVVMFKFPLPLLTLPSLVFATCNWQVCQAVLSCTASSGHLLALDDGHFFTLGKSFPVLHRLLSGQEQLTGSAAELHRKLHVSCCPSWKQSEARSEQPSGMYSPLPSASYFQVSLLFVFFLAVVGGQDRLTRCAQQCSDNLEDELQANSSPDRRRMAQMQAEACLNQCADKHIPLVNKMMQRIREELGGCS